MTHAITYSSTFFTNLKVYATTTDALGKLFTRNDFSISTARVSFRASRFVEDKTLDFYILTYD